MGNEKKKKSKRKIKFKESILNPVKSGNSSPPYLVKQRVPLSGQLNFPKFKATSIEWLKLYTKNSSKAIPLKRSLIGSQSEALLEPELPKPKPQSKDKSIQTNLNLKIRDKIIIPRNHLKVSQSPGVIKDVKFPLLPEKPLVKHPETRILTTRIVHKASPSYTCRDFDSSIIPDKMNSCLTIHDLLKYMEYIQPFK
ncbi:hypothetical protein SteCoe_4584 [Stentor coeruleus]|uniref:Uncharacterized protein n=1 Tax=Stentor coeruleus TaxID=5963 RepID=A0A1R2CUB5_9CILI|nr:hypothetical protein SteCoe_4584 [Stentor coeruleus]